MVNNKTLVAILLAIAFCATFSHAAPHRYRRTAGATLDPLAAATAVCTPLLTAVDGLTGTVTATINVATGTAGAVVAPLLTTATGLVQGIVSGGLLGLNLGSLGAVVGGVGNTLANCVNVLTHLSLGDLLHISGLCNVPLKLNGILMSVLDIQKALNINLSGSGSAAVEIHN